MRSIGTLAVVTGLLLLGSSCDGGGGITPPENTAPVADFAMPACIINVPCDFVSTSTDDAEVTEWSWDFDGDGTPDANTATAAYQYKAAGDFSVSLTVHDAQGLSHAKTSTITIAPVPPNNPPPTASFTYDCDVTACSFVSTSSDVAPGTIASYAWNFGDGTTADVNNPSHGYNVTTATDFTVSLTVTDNQGATAVASQTVTVDPVPNAPPSAGFTYACNLAVCSFVSTSTDVAPGTIASFAWTFGDNGIAAVNSPSHTYSVTARTEFTVTLTVTDNQGATAVETKLIAVDPVPPTNQPPSARFIYSCTAAAVCTFVSTSFDHGGKVTAQAWTFGDGGTATEISPSHSYTVTAITEFTVTLTVTDNEGATGVTSQTIKIDPTATNQPPTAAFTPWCYGEGCIFFSKSTDVAPGAIVSYAWTFGDGTAAEWRNWTFPNHLETHVYTISARTQFTVTLTVTDNEGATAVSTQTVTLSPLPPAVQGCTTSGKVVDCVLDIPTQSTLKVTVNGVSCDLVQKVSTPPPVGDQMFLSVCNNKVGDATGIFGGVLDELWVYQAGSQARIWFTQGNSTRALNPPAGRLEGTYPDWTLSFEDGDHPGAPGEPDFTDIVIGVHATAR
jgi:PKD repeat protein